MHSLPNLSARFRSSRGSILGNLMAGVLLLCLVAGTLTVLNNLSKGRVWGKNRVAAHEALVQKLDALINSPATSGQLAATTSTPHTEGDLEWDVKDVTPRLKRIEIRAAIAGANSKSVGQVGFRYDDF